MAQTTTAQPRSNYQIEVSTDGSTWTDISGSSNQVNPSGGDQMYGEQHTAAGNAPTITATHKTGAITLTCNILYTETAGEAFQVVWARYEGTAKTIYFRYTPGGGDTGDERYTATNNAGTAIAVPIINCLPPATDAGSGDPAMASFTIVTPKLTQAVIS